MQYGLGALILYQSNILAINSVSTLAAKVVSA